MQAGEGKSVPGRSNFASVDGWRRTLVGADVTIQEAVRNLDATGLQIALVISSDGALLGTVTDGDIRRGLLRGLGLNSPLLPIVKRDPVVVPPEISGETVLHLMQANGFSAIPIVNSGRQVLGLHLLKELLAPGKRLNRMVIMAGGQGTRLRPQTENCPKPMLPVGGKPMLQHIVERAKADGFERFVVTTYFLGEMIEEYFGDGSRWQVEIEYIRETIPTGTAGAIALLNPRPDSPFLVSNGDVLTDVRYGEMLDFHSRHGAIATMAVRLHEWQHPFGVVRTNGVDIVGFEEKPVARSHINAGIYVFEPEALDSLKEGEYCDMPTLFARLQERGRRTIVYPMHEPWLDVGRAEDLKQAQPADALRKDL